MILMQSQLSLAYCCVSGIRQPLEIKEGGWIIHAYNSVGQRFGVARYSVSEKDILDSDWLRLEEWLESGCVGVFKFSETEFSETSYYPKFDKDGRHIHYMRQARIKRAVGGTETQQNDVLAEEEQHGPSH